MNNKLALIFGITGQDGAYLADFLLKKKYKVIGTTRNLSKKNLIRLFKLKIENRVSLLKIKRINHNVIKDLFKKLKKIDEIYYLSGETSPLDSMNNPLETFDSNVNNLVSILEFIKIKKFKTKIFYASSSEIFKNKKPNIFNENSEIGPRTPYAISKAAGFWLIKYYRNNYKVNCCTGILFNHESPLRSKNFVFKKIIEQTQKIKKEKRGKLQLGNIKIKRDIGWAPDYIVAIWKMLQLKKFEDLVIGSGKAYSIQEFLNLVLKYLKLNESKIVFNKKELIRKNDLIEYKANPSLALKKIRWKNTLSIEKIIEKMLNDEYY